MSEIETMMPNTALEPTAITPVRLRFGRRLAEDFRRRGSAFGRQAAYDMRNQSIISIGMAVAISFLCGCKTRPGDDMSPGDAMVMAPFIVIGAIIVSPVYIADKTWELSSDGIKTHVYASSGTSLGDFKRAIDTAEGETCYGQYEPDHDNVMRFKYRGKKAVYYGRFVDGLAIKY